MNNKISQAIAKAFRGNGRTSEHDIEIGNAMLLADECEKVLREICEHNHTYFLDDADTANPSGLHNKVKRARALLAKLESQV